MNGRCFFDTNVLIYAFQTGDKRSEIAQGLLAEGGIVSVQSLNEFVAVTRRKLAMSWDEIREALSAIEALCPSPRAITVDTHRRALFVVQRYSYRIYDSLLIASATEADCQTLYSEDLRDGQVIEGLAIVNPFRATQTAPR